MGKYVSFITKHTRELTSNGDDSGRGCVVGAKSIYAVGEARCDVGEGERAIEAGL